MSRVLETLEPKAVFHFFEDLTRIPHGSRNTKAISDYCVAFAKERGLWVYQDALNNVIIKKPASAGYETAPAVILQAMQQQITAEREKRAVILKADGEKQAAITAAEGEKEAAILRADAVKQQRILEAEGEAQAILAVQKANADAIRLLNEAMPSDKVLAIRSLEALAKVANGKATKIIIPSELQNLGGVVPSIKELMTDPKDAE